jgi:arylsulfatase A-like enzyme
MVLALALLWEAFSGSAPVAAQTSPRPNFVFILADDMRYDELAYMPKTTNLLGSAQDMTFTRAYVAMPLCCPSRTSILTGMYTHNHKVWFNDNVSVGGWKEFKALGHEQDNLATRLDDAGYRTGLFGKYVKNYDGSSVPSGWDYWFGHSGGSYYG